MNRCKPGFHVAITALAVVALTLAVTVCSAAGASKKIQKLKGIVTEVTTTSLTVDDGKNGEVVIHTSQDYSDRVSVGMQVTAWHYEQAGAQRLERLEYPLESSPVAPGDFIPRIKKAILLPGSNAGDADAIFTEVELLLQSRFNWLIANRMVAEEVRRRSMKENNVNSAFEVPESAMTHEPLFPAGPELIRRVAEGARADAVLEVRVEYILLKVTSSTAEWDGQRETFGSQSARFASAITMRPVRGQVPVATVALRLFDAQGNLLWRNRRGFRVLALQVSMGSKFRDRPLSEAAEDSAFMSEWLGQVFASWLKAGPSPGGTTAKR